MKNACPFCFVIFQSRKTNKQGGEREGGWGHTFLNPLPPPPLNFSFFNFIPGNSRQICLLSNPYKIPRPKTKTPLEIPHYFFFTLGNSTSFLDNPWKFNMLFLWYPWPWKFHILNSLLFFFFSGIAHCISSFKGYVLQKFVKYNQQVFYFLFLWLPSTVSEKKKKRFL